MAPVFRCERGQKEKGGRRVNDVYFEVGREKVVRKNEGENGYSPISGVKERFYKRGKIVGRRGFHRRY